MTDQDYDAFGRELRRLWSACERFPLKAEDGSVKIDAYFHALKHLPIREVSAKADAWLRKETHMPKPAEWAGQLVASSVEIPTMSADEARDWLEAERQRWEGSPCGCAECREAGVTTFPRRFVPLVDGNGCDLHRRIGERVVTAGMWVHGYALGRWYVAQEACRSAFQAVGQAGAFARIERRREAPREASAA